MRLHQKEPFTAGYQSITEFDGKHSEMLMDFGILKLTAGMEFTDEKPLERVFVLLYGEIEVEFGGKTVKGVRPTYTDDTIWSVNLPKNIPVKLRGVAEDSEVAVIRTENERDFDPVIRTGSDVVEEVRGKGFMNEAEPASCARRRMSNCPRSPISCSARICIIPASGRGFPPIRMRSRKFTFTSSIRKTVSACCGWVTKACCWNTTIPC